MQKWKTKLLLVLVAAVCLGQSTQEIESPAVNGVAAKMNCSCGCKLNMACKMDPYPCHICHAAKIKILSMQQGGKSEKEILDSFVAENGPDVMVVPPGLAGTLGPYIALAIGLGLVAWTIRRYMGHKPAPATEIDAAVLEHIEKDMSKLD